jgi:hypothetical protein
MKNILMFILLFVVAVIGKAQTLPNNDFETWETVEGIEQAEFWDSPNTTGIISVTKTEDAYSGSYAARLETIEVLNGLFIVPGLITLADFSVNFSDLSFSLKGGYFLRENVSKLTGMYKYTGVEGDSASVIIYNFRHPEGEEIDTIGAGFAFLHDAEDWTPFEVIMVNANYHVPDTFNVMIVSSGSEQMQVGSLLLIDSLAIETNTGVIDLWNPPMPLHVYPNPAADAVNFEADNAAPNRELIIYDLNGQMVYRSGFDGKNIRVDTKSFSPGMFSYSLLENGRRVRAGSFVKK